MSKEFPSPDDQFATDEVDGAQDVPDPSGPVSPVPFTNKRAVSLRTWLANIGLGCVGLGLILPLMRASSCAGATRSSRIEFQNRNATIDSILEQEQQDDLADRVDG